ncbi:Lipase member H [Halotydeus destructor]|nr:Lipase member H [Halotydeus destructor]
MGDILVALHKIGIISFVLDNDLIQNQNNSQGPVAFVYRQLLTQIPAFVSNTLRDCMETEIQNFTGETANTIPRIERDKDVTVIRFQHKSRFFDDGEACPGISAIFPKDSCLGRPTVSTDPAAEPKKTTFIFFDKNGTEARMKYDDFLLKNKTRRRLLKNFFDPKAETNILIHGWTDYYYRDGWMWSLKEFLLKSPSKPNIMIVDWSQWSQSLAITKVKMNSGIVSDQLASVMYVLTHEPYSKKDMLLDSRKIYFFTHSYGGPIAGRACEFFKGLTNDETNVAGILALDPSDQCFGRGSFVTDDPTSANHVYSSLLDASSADDVKVIHTDNNAFGAYWRLGSVDIYVNQGSGQPDCPADLSSLTNVDLLYTLACSHYRATRILTQPYYEQDGGKCQPVAFRCASFDDFVSGVCACLFTDRSAASSLLIGSSGRCRQLAAHRYETTRDGTFESEYEAKPNLLYSRARDTRDSWYILMGSEPPYCLGTFFYSLQSSEIPNNVISSLTIDDNPSFEFDASSNRQGILFLAPEKVGIFKQIILSYEDVPGELLGEQRKFGFHTLSMYYMSHYDYCTRNKYSGVYCAYNGEFGDRSRATKLDDCFPKTRPSWFIHNRDKIHNRSLSGDYQELQENFEKSSYSCVAFVTGFLKDYLLAIQDQFCADDDEVCVQFLECLYAVRRNSDQYSDDEKYYKDILDKLYVFDFKGYLYNLIVKTGTDACEGLLEKFEAKRTGSCDVTVVHGELI